MFFYWCVLSPLLFILYTDDCRSTFHNRYMLKFADDTEIVSLLANEETSHGPVVEDFVSWCANCNLNLNVSKTLLQTLENRPFQSLLLL